MSDQSDQPQRPTTDDRAAWRAYWQAQGMPWRTEPEIDEARQQYLAERRAITPDRAQGIYSFKGVEPKLTRADVEWLLATHESGGMVGPVNWEDEKQREREGLDLRGADLRGAFLYELPLTRLCAGLTHDEWAHTPLLRQELVAVHLEGAFLSGAHLEGAILGVAHLESATLEQAHLEGAVLVGAHLNPAYLTEAHLEGANLFRARLEGAVLFKTHLAGASLFGAHLKRASLREAHLEGAALNAAHLEGANLYEAHLEGKPTFPDELARVLRWRQKDQGDIPETMPPADLRGTFFDAGTNLTKVVLGDKEHGYVRLADVSWGGVNLAVVDWTPFTDRKALLGDEQAARDFKPKPFAETEEQRKRPRQERARARAEHVAQQAQEQLQPFQAAVRANRQLATALRDQGMNEEADYFAYRAQLVQHRVFGQQGKRGRQLLSGFLDLVAGYGYRPLRSLMTYIVVVCGFAVAYYFLGAHVTPPLSVHDAIVFSITSFHGRGFSPGASITLHDPLTTVAAIEAIIGLLIEITFIATFTQRFFAR